MNGDVDVRRKVFIIFVQARMAFSFCRLCCVEHRKPSINRGDLSNFQKICK